MHKYQHRLILLLILVGLALLVPARGLAQVSSSTRSRSRQSRQTRPVTRVSRCLPGNWQADSYAVQRYMLAANPDSTLADVSGRLTYYFARGSANYYVEFDKVRFYFKPRNDEIIVTVDGFGRASYREASAGTLTISDIIAQPETNATLNGEPFSSQPIAVEAIFAPGSFAYQCSGNMLRLTPQGQQRTATLVLKRIG